MSRRASHLSGLSTLVVMGRFPDTAAYTFPAFLAWLSCHVMSPIVFSRLSYPNCPIILCVLASLSSLPVPDDLAGRAVPMYCPIIPVRSIIFWPSCSLVSVLADLSRLPCMTVLSRLFCPDYSVLASYPSCPVPELFFPIFLRHGILSLLSSSNGPGPIYSVSAEGVPDAPSWLSCPGCPVVAVMSRMFCHGCPFPTVPSQVSFTGCPGVAVLSVSYRLN